MHEPLTNRLSYQYLLPTTAIMGVLQAAESTSPAPAVHTAPVRPSSAWYPSRAPQVMLKGI